MNPSFDSLKRKPDAEEDLPPGTGGTYYGGPLSNPKPTPTPPEDDKKKRP